MIIVLTRDDVPRAHARRTVEDLKLYHMGLPVDAIKKADIIVYVEGEALKFFKNTLGEQSFHSLEALLYYIKNPAQSPPEHDRIPAKHLPKVRRPHGNYRRRKP